MTSAVIYLLADVMVAVILIISIGYSIKLNKRIRILQDSKSELAALIKKFDESTEAATVGINEIHKASKVINDHINAKVEKANYIADDLAFMIEKGSKITEKIKSVAEPAPLADEAVARGTRTRGRAKPKALPREGRVSAVTDDRDAELEMMKQEVRDKKKSALRATAEGKKSGGAEQLVSADNKKGKLRSKAEKELFDALNSEY